MREVIARVVDASDLLDFKPDYGPTTVCGHAAVQALRSASSPTMAHSIRPARPRPRTLLIVLQSSFPIVYLRTPAASSAAPSEEGDMIGHGSMIKALWNAGERVTAVALMCGTWFGAGDYGMSQHAYDPRFLFMWPNAHTAMIGTEQAALTMANVMGRQARRRNTDTAQIDALGYLSTTSRASSYALVTFGACSTTASSIHATPAMCSAWRSRSAARRIRARSGPFSSASRGHEVASDRQPQARSPAASCVTAEADGRAHGRRVF